MKKTFVSVILLGLLVILFASIFYIREKGVVFRVTDFISCAENGFPVMESYPRQCATPDGRTFVEVLTEDDVEIPETNEAGIDDLIRVTSPLPQSTLSSPFLISGEARGNWFFEASFPAVLLDANEKEIAIMPITAQGEWMTENFVSFSSSMMFGTVTTNTGTLVLKKDNPSGLPEFDAEVRIPIIFDPSLVSSEPTAGSECRPTGCSGQLCADQDLVSTCEFKEEYACYGSAVCKRQQNGECGWTQTTALAECISNAQK